MAKLFITELNSVGIPQVAQIPPITEQVVIFNASTQSTALNAQTTMIRVCSDTTCHISIGANPTATTTNLRLTADAPEYFLVSGGLKIAAVTA